MCDTLEIKPSSIEGNGLFTILERKIGEKIIDYFGEEMSLKQFNIMYGLYKTNSLHTYRMKRINRIIVAKEEPYLSLNLINNINESMTPNCILKKRALYALRNIQAGEELTLKYPSDYYRSYKLQISKLSNNSISSTNPISDNAL